MAVRRSAARHRGLRVMTREHSAAEQPGHPAISPTLRPLPRPSPETSSGVQILLQGVAMSGIRCVFLPVGNISATPAKAMPPADLAAIALRAGPGCRACAANGFFRGRDSGRVGLRLDGWRRLRQRSEGGHHALRREARRSTSVPTRTFDFSVKVPPCRSIRLLAIGRPSPAPCSADLIEVRALAEGRQHDRDFLLGNAGAGVLARSCIARRTRSSRPSARFRRPAA